MNLEGHNGLTLTVVLMPGLLARLLKPLAALVLSALLALGLAPAAAQAARDTNSYDGNI